MTEVDQAMGLDSDLDKSSLPHQITVNGINVQIVRKAIKNLHLAVYPPDGQVRVAVPENITDDNVRLAIVSKLAWISKQQQYFKLQSRQSERQFISGESHYFMGQRYRLELVVRPGKHEVQRHQSGRLTMYVQAGTSRANKEKLLDAWYRSQLNERLPILLAKWQPLVGREVRAFSIKKMKTKWGSCTIAQRRIWLNLELAKKPPQCLEYLLVHELVHLLERRHNEVFRAHMDRLLPRWRALRKLLNQSPLAHEDWLY